MLFPIRYFRMLRVNDDYNVSRASPRRFHTSPRRHELIQRPQLRPTSRQRRCGCRRFDGLLLHFLRFLNDPGTPHSTSKSFFFVISRDCILKTTPTARPRRPSSTKCSRFQLENITTHRSETRRVSFFFNPLHIYNIISTV